MNTYIWKYVIYCSILVVNLLHVSVTVVAIVRECLYEGYITQTLEHVYKYKLLSFKGVIQDIC